VIVMWDFIPVPCLAEARAVLPTGSRVARLGTVSFVRSGFARVRWDDGTVSDEWAAELAIPRDRLDGRSTAAGTAP
jgi:hypothetical protein